MSNHSIFNITATNIIAANRLINSPIAVTSTRTNREYWGIMLKTKGKTVYNCQGREIVSDCTHPVILPKGCSYTWKCVEPGECIGIEFDADIKEDMIYSFSINDTSFIINSFAKIEKKLTLKNPGYKMECFTALYSLLLYFAKSDNKEYIPLEKQNIIKPAMLYIAEHYFDNTITNDFLASLCSISTVYFRKLFKLLYGVSIGCFLQNLRIEKAKSLLSGDYESITQVAESVGYSSIYHFSKMFKQTTGFTPSEYANRK